ncbi:N-acetylglucosamine-1-phosphate uridyltransferase [Haloferax mediterranei ATCC 33500]|uniref:ATP-NAD kinase n=1 Tax=Haloferax mediterranei (strain ATCC 33500 / DSM 1411 / JCM 8866 / NBRC 14739 / NCIMB 2177 / R-4) TaxID=523841 RepID=I3R3U5_HALMT|nr:ATP-NAD kinase family protein [Haloferax mediterranei]AFK18905.1 ATP-NAD kinase [Haloferax mediterranei ATCC 33500]AHZ21731.1 N-acetylglucosamine-1-phosphate uridyltransferase [Haloferax mediterranei ATCC 33500]EMA03236.1 ATP-NAD kinase [Haloferax mediterranei ATCC 33500]MDX5988998.1 ATP-NAD kinase family protein [Haloferax mediterranei ATCC 33500]QCQ75391.1 N-acetylglucosamine-1-phosphate uridyltransferase [Haloferax mediterranei ATCC 33500]
MRIGVVVNPVAGMGGRVGLKGTDGKVEEARARGAEPRSPDRARRALSQLFDAAPDTEILAWGGGMGESVARDAGFDPEELGEPDTDETSAADTIDAVRAFVEAGVDLVLFVGGDGTAADVAEALDGSDVPMLGVPAGVKVYSSVFAVSPEDAAHIATSFERTEAREVMDIDEDNYRAGEVHPELRAVAHVPVAEDLQSSKQTSGGTVEALASGVADDIRSSEGVTYVLGPGSTVGAVKSELDIDGSPLGVDVYRDGEVLVRDATEDEILANLGEENVIVVTPIGGQGFVFGRGNPQLSPDVIRRCDVSVVASRSKLDTIPVLRVDTDDTDLDEELRGWTKVRVGRVERRMMKIE